MSEWARLANASGRRIVLENCHQGGLIPGQIIPGQHCDGREAECPYHVFRTSDDIYNHWENAINNINSVTPYLSQADATIVPRSRPGCLIHPSLDLPCPNWCATISMALIIELLLQAMGLPGHA